MNIDYLIIGGGIAGTTAAETIRSRDKDGTIAIITKEPYTLYSRVLLPKYIEGNISREQTFLRSSEHYNRNGISFFAGEEVTILDPARSEVRTRSGMVFFYKQLLIAAGGRVKPWRVEGSDITPIFRLQTIDDADGIRAAMLESATPGITLVGGGFITLEILDAVAGHGIPLHVFFPETRYWEKLLDADGSEFLEAHLERTGIQIHHGEAVTMIRQKEEGGGVLVHTSRRTGYETGIVAVGIGLDRELTPFTGVGIEIERGIKTNEFLETAVQNIWAAGDIADHYQPVFQKHILIGNWNNAFLQGRAAGLNMAERQLHKSNGQPYFAIPLYSLDVLGLHISFIGSVFSEPGEAENLQYVTRYRPNVFYERFAIKERRLIGAILMNKFEDRQVLERIIREQRDVLGKLSVFADASVNLSEQFE